MALRGSVTGSVFDDMTEEQAQTPTDRSAIQRPEAPAPRVGAKLDRWNKWLTLGPMSAWCSD